MIRSSAADVAALLRRCGSCKDLVQGRQIHALLRESEQDRETFLGNLLVQMYGSCGMADEAFAAFERIAKRNVFSWNIMISAFAQAGHWQQAYKFFRQMPERDQVSWNGIIAAFARAGDLDYVLQLLEEMKRSGVHPNRLTFVSILDSEGDLFDVLEDAKFIHCKIAQHGFHADLQVQTALIGVYDRLGSVKDAVALFDRMDNPDVIAWNSLLSAFARAGDIAGENSLFQQMPERNLASWSIAIAANLHSGHPKIALWLFQVMDLEGGVAADRTVFITALYACGLLEELKTGEAIHGEILGLNLESDVYVGTALIVFYGRCHQLDLARDAFDGIREKNQVAWNAIITAYTQNGRFDLARSLFDLMPASDVVSWTLMLTEFAQKGRVLEARDIFDRIPVRDTASWNAMISAHAANGENSQALKLLAEMDLEGLEVERGTYISILKSHLSASEATLLQELISESSDCRSDCSVATALVSMHGRSARVAAAREIFEASREKNVVLWSAVIAVYADNGHFDAALEMFFRMNLDGVHPNDVTFVSVLSACAHAGGLSDARQQFFAVSADFGVAHSREHYVCMADMLARSGLMEQAQALVNEMPYVPDNCSWKTVLAGCVIAGNVKQAEQVAGRAFEFGSRDDPSSYIMLSNVYATRDEG